MISGIVSSPRYSGGPALMHITALTSLLSTITCSTLIVSYFFIILAKKNICVKSSFTKRDNIINKERIFDLHSTYVLALHHLKYTQLILTFLLFLIHNLVLVLKPFHIIHDVK